MRTTVLALILSIVGFATTLFHAAPAPAPISAKLESTPADKQAIQALLDNYTKAVSNKDQALFESLLLNKSISFSHVNAAAKKADQEDGSRNYEQFRKAVFEGPPFTQRFQNIEIRQDGILADVSLVFVNTSASGVGWGWKTLQLLKVDGRWKIASEFFTTHS